MIRQEQVLMSQTSADKIYQTLSACYQKNKTIKLLKPVLQELIVEKSRQRRISNVKYISQDKHTVRIHISIFFFHLQQFISYEGPWKGCTI